MATGLGIDFSMVLVTIQVHRSRRLKRIADMDHR